MNRFIQSLTKFFCFSYTLLLLSGCMQDESLGIFEGHNDIGKILIPGSIKYDSEKDSYEIAGSGENMWFNEDALHYVWKQVSGDVSLTADIAWIGEGKNPHRKAGIMIRDGIESDDAYVDVVIHGDGLTSMQYRKTKGGNTYEIQAPVKAPNKIKLEKTGKQYTF